jgi:hypothetical protein
MQWAAAARARRKRHRERKLLESYLAFYLDVIRPRMLRGPNCAECAHAAPCTIATAKARYPAGRAELPVVLRSIRPLMAKPPWRASNRSPEAYYIQSIRLASRSGS